MERGGEQEVMKITVERAIEILDPAHRERYSDLLDGMEQINEACRMGMEALKKQLPKKPIFKTGESIFFVDYADGGGEAKANKWADWVCPSCGWFVGEQYIPRRHNQQKSAYCTKCGQAIDWLSAETCKSADRQNEQK